MHYAPSLLVLATLSPMALLKDFLSLQNYSKSEFPPLILAEQRKISPYHLLSIVIIYIYIYFYRIYHIWNKYINETCKSILSKIAYDMDSITISACIFMNQYDIGNLGRKPLGWDPMNDGRPHMHVFITMCTAFEVPAEPCIYHAFFTMLLVLDSIIPR